jgi:hypothetical protein
MTQHENRGQGSKPYLDGLITVRPGELGPGIRPNAKTARLKREISETAKVMPIEITHDGFIVDGEHRYRVLCDLGVQEIPAFVGTQLGASGRLERPYRGLMLAIEIPAPEKHYGVLRHTLSASAGAHSERPSARDVGDHASQGAIVDAEPASLDASLEALKARHQGVQIRVSLRTEGLVLSMIRVPDELQRRQGRADAALKDLVTWADRHGKVMALTPERVGKGASNTALERWYRRHGFVANRGRNKNFDFLEAMIRSPRTVERDLEISPESPGMEASTRRPSNLVRESRRRPDDTAVIDRVPERPDEAGFEL